MSIETIREALESIEAIDHNSRIITESVEIIRAALSTTDRDAWKAKAERYREALVKVMAHIGIPLVPTYELLYGLIESIERISTAALQEDGKAEVKQ